MHDAKSTRLPLVAALAIAVVASSAVAASRCEKPCKAETPACIGERCAGLGGTARHACLETCKGIGGCARIGTLYRGGGTFGWTRVRGPSERPWFAGVAQNRSGLVDPHARRSI
jgi:hypothetical protein